MTTKTQFMKRGCARHSALQREMLRSIKTVRDLENRRAGVCKTLCSKIYQVIDGDKLPLNKRVHVFHEVTLNRIGMTSRRADLVVYVPGVALFCVEYKTSDRHAVDGENTKPHQTQLKQTHNNLAVTLAFENSKIPPGADEKKIKLVSLLLTSKYNAGKRIGHGVCVNFSDTRLFGNVTEMNETHLVSVLRRLSVA